MRQPIPFGKYLLLDRISVGGMAEVFKAKSYGVEGFEKVLAIKRILPSMGEDRDFIKMFIDEAKIAGQLAHANICQIFELGRADGAHFIAMEYIWGKDLLQVQNRLRKLDRLMTPAMACFVTAKVCEGLDYAHRKRDPLGRPLEIVHRDCSPQNVLISYEGEVKLIDFGIAKAASRSSRTVAGVLKGKFGYMSPEQVRGLPLDRRSDVFALGTILYESLTGERLFQGASDFSTLEKVRNVSITPPRELVPSIPEELERIVMRSLAREQEDRYQWCGEMGADLQQFLMRQPEAFTAKTLATWLKDAFAVEMERERDQLESFKRVGRDGLIAGVPQAEARLDVVTHLGEAAPADDPTMLGAPSFDDLNDPVGGVHVPLNVPAAGTPAHAAARSAPPRRRDEFGEEAPTEIYGEIGASDDSVTGVPAPALAPPAAVARPAPGVRPSSSASRPLPVAPRSSNAPPQGPRSSSPTAPPPSPPPRRTTGPVAVVGTPPTSAPPTTPPPRRTTGPVAVVGSAPSSAAPSSAAPSSAAPSSAAASPATQASKTPTVLGMMSPFAAAPGQVGLARPMGMAPSAPSQALHGVADQTPAMQGMSGSLAHAAMAPDGTAPPMFSAATGPMFTPSGLMVGSPGTGVPGQPPFTPPGLPSYADARPAAASPALARRRASLAKDIAIGVAIAAVVLGLFAGGKYLFFGDRSAAAPAPAAGTLVVTVPDPRPAEVFVNDEHRGTVEGGGLTVENVVAGDYTVRVVREGAPPCERVIHLAAGKVESVKCAFAAVEPRPSDAVAVDAGVLAATAVDAAVAIALAPPGSAAPAIAVDAAAPPVAAVPDAGAPPPTSPLDPSGKPLDPSSKPDKPARAVGYLAAETTPAAQVFIDGVDTGKTTPLTGHSRLSLSPGPHKVMFVVDRQKLTFRITVVAGKEIKLVKDLQVTP